MNEDEIRELRERLYAMDDYYDKSHYYDWIVHDGNEFMYSTEYMEYIKRFIEGRQKRPRVKKYMIGLPVEINDCYVSSFDLKTNVGIITNVNVELDRITVRAVQNNNLYTRIDLEIGDYKLLAGGI